MEEDNGRSSRTGTEDMRAKKSAQQFQAMLETRKNILTRAEKLANSTTTTLRKLQKRFDQCMPLCMHGKLMWHFA
jgi:hypothetical protein